MILERFRNDSAKTPQPILREICMKSSWCIEHSLDKAYIDSARLPLGFRNDSGMIPLRFCNPLGVKSA